jgi:PAS domain S-box-containing protein
MLAKIADWLFNPSRLTPHGFCLLWDPALIWIHACADAVIGVAYFTIPVAMAVYARRRRDLVFRPVLWLCAGFILLCGSGHWLDLLTLWVPVYRLEGVVKVATALVSASTAVTLWYLLPTALALPSPQQMRQARQRLSESQAQVVSMTKSLDQLRRLVDASPTALILSGADGTIKMVNAMAERVFEYPRQELQDRRLDLLLPGGCARLVQGAADAAPMPSQLLPAEQDFYGARRNGARFPVEIGVSVIDVDGEPMVLAGISDITARREGERATQQQQALERANADLIRARHRAERATRAKSRFLAGMSHELRTPLNGILGYAQLLDIEGGLDPSQAARVAAMRGAGQHLLQMINSVLDFSEIEAGHVTLRPVPLDAYGIALECLDSLRAGGETKGLALSCCAAADVPERIVADPTRLRQILLNLIGNAIKFTAQGAIEVRLRLVRSDDAAPRPASRLLASRLVISVADTGRGVPADRRADLFREFERLGDRHDGEGSGLGLAISARLAALMGGEVRHADNPTGGSVFSLSLPLAVDMPDEAPASFPPAEPAGYGGELPQSLRILLADDVAMNLDITTAFLRAEGHLVTGADGGTAAVAAAAHEDFDVVLMDLRMPDMDGFEAVRRIRALGGARSRVPVVALTAEAFSEQIEECRRAGMIGHLAKPFTMAALLGTVAKAVADAGMQAGGSQAPAAPACPSRPSLSWLPVIDPEVFRANAAFLSADAVQTHLGHIEVSIEAVLAAIRAGDAVPPVRPDMMEAVHTLAGSAGLFGFVRLTETARRFSYEAQQGGIDQMLTADLTAALEVSLWEMRHYVRAEANAPS